jgi:hypothetical protein
MDVIMHVDPTTNEISSVKVERYKLPDTSTPKEKMDVIMHVDPTTNEISSVKVERFSQGKVDVSTPKGDDISWGPFIGWSFNPLKG